MEKRVCLPSKGMRLYSDGHSVLPSLRGVVFIVRRQCLNTWLVHTGLQVASILTVPVVNYFQYDPSSYSVSLHGMARRCVSAGKCRPPVKLRTNGG